MITDIAHPGSHPEALTTSSMKAKCLCPLLIIAALMLHSTSLMAQTAAVPSVLDNLLNLDTQKPGSDPMIESLEKELSSLLKSTPDNSPQDAGPRELLDKYRQPTRLLPERTARPDTGTTPGTNIPAFINAPKPAFRPEVREDGRQVVGDQQKSGGIFRYIGILTAKGLEAKAWGTATLISPRHIITAGHVCVELDKLKKKGLGETVFLLPDGRSSIIEQMEIDAGWKNPAFDIAVCTLRDSLGENGHANWDTFKDSHFNTNIHLSGYDKDLAAKDHKGLLPQLVDRQGIVEKCDQNMKKRGIPLTVISGAVMFYPKNTSITSGGLLYGGAALFAGYNILKNAVFDTYGWQAPVFAEVGASGGPIWVDYGGCPVVLGVQSALTMFGSEVRRAGLGIQWQPAGVVGSRITSGPCERMIEDHIGGHPKVSCEEDDLRLVFMAYPPGSKHQNGRESKPGHAFVGFRRNGEFEQVKGFEPDGGDFLDLLTPDFSSDLSDNRKYIPMATIQFEWKVSASIYNEAINRKKKVYVGILNDCVTYAATIADIANLNRPKPTDGIFYPVEYIKALQAMNPD